MYIDNEAKKAKIGRINVYVRGGSVKLRFTYPKKTRETLTAATDTETGWIKAIQTAQMINNDIELNQYDPTLAKYSIQRAAKLELATKAPNLLDLWESYKLVSKERVAATTKKTHWRQYETNYLGDIFKKDPSLLEILNSDKFISYLLEKYKPATIKPIFSNCLMPSVNLAVKKGTIERNPYLDVELPKGVSSEIDCYSSDEVKMIIQNFYDSTSDYYGTLIEFIALTGCRPEEAVALVSSDVKTKGGRTYIKFSKAYSNRILLPHTKNRAIRLFPVNEQLETLINFIEPQKNGGTKDVPKGLFFPSPKGKYITWNNVRNRHWIPIVNKLIEQGKLDRYIKPYSLRHSAITRWLAEGISIASVAKLSGNSSKVIMDNYWKAETGYDIPLL